MANLKIKVNRNLSASEVKELFGLDSGAVKSGEEVSFHVDDVEKWKSEYKKKLDNLNNERLNSYKNSSAGKQRAFWAGQSEYDFDSTEDILNKQKEERSSDSEQDKLTSVYNNDYSFTKTDGTLGYLPNNDHIKNYNKYKESHKNATVEDYLKASNLWDFRDSIATIQEVRSSGASRDESNFAGLAGSGDKKYYNKNDYDEYKQNVHQSLENAKDVAKTGAAIAAGGMMGASTLFLPGITSAASGINSIINSSPVSLTLGAYGLGDSAHDMYKNGIDLGNSVEMVGSTLPYLKLLKGYTKVGNELYNKYKSTKLGLYFDPELVKVDNGYLKHQLKIRLIPTKEKAELLFRYRAPQAVKSAANLTLDFSAGVAGSQLASNLTDNLDNYWNYNFDDSGNVIKDLNYYAKNGINSTVNALGFTAGMGARSGALNARNLLTGATSFGLGGYGIDEGLSAAENKFNLKDNFVWSKLVRPTSQYLLPALMHSGLNKVGAENAVKRGSTSQQDLIQARNTWTNTMADAAKSSVLAVPAVASLNNLLPDDMHRKEDFTSMLGSHIGGKAINVKQALSNAFENTGGALKYNGQTIRNVLEGILAGDLNTFRYTGSYHNNDGWMRGSTKYGGLYGIEKLTYSNRPIKDIKTGETRHYKALGYDLSLGRNFAEEKDSSKKISWWNIHTGSYAPQVGEHLNPDSKVVRVTTDYTKNSDAASMIASNHSSRFNRVPLVEIRTNSSLLGGNDVPAEYKPYAFSNGEYFWGIERGDRYYTGPSEYSLNVVGSNGVAYSDSQGRILGILLVDYTNPGVRRILPSNTMFGRAVRTVGDVLTMTKSKRNGDNYYNKDNDGSKKADLLYLSTRLATHIAENALRNQVISTTGYKDFKSISSTSEFNLIRDLMFDPNKKGVEKPSVERIKALFKGTSLENESIGVLFEEYINMISKFEGNSFSEKYSNFVKDQRQSGLSDKMFRIDAKEQNSRANKQYKLESRKYFESIKNERKSNREILKLSKLKESKFYIKSSLGKTHIDETKLDKVFSKDKNNPTRCKREVFEKLPKDIQQYVLDNYNVELMEGKSIFHHYDKPDKPIEIVAYDDNHSVEGWKRSKSLIARKDLESSFEYSLNLESLKHARNLVKSEKEKLKLESKFEKLLSADKIKSLPKNLLSKDKVNLVKEEYFLALPEELQQLIKENYSIELYKQGKKLIKRK